MPLNLVTILDSLFNVLYFILLARIILSWFPIRPGGMMQDVIEVLYSITEPILGPIRRLIPPVAMGGGFLDLSPLILLLILRLLRGMLF